MKRWLILLLSGCMALVLLTGCGSSETQETAETIHGLSSQADGDTQDAPQADDPAQEEEAEEAAPDETTAPAEPAAATEEPVVSQPTQSQTSSSVSGGYMVEGVYGTKFWVPEGFVAQETQSAMGYLYAYHNEALNMDLTVSEVLLDVLSTMIGVSVEELSDVTYHTSRLDTDTYYYVGNNFIVSSGYVDQGETIYYQRTSVENGTYTSYHFSYPNENRSQGDKIVEAFFARFSNPPA